jgi:hypothetical protein
LVLAGHAAMLKSSRAAAKTAVKKALMSDPPYWLNVASITSRVRCRCGGSPQAARA